jgi:hypothetical protein
MGIWQLQQQVDSSGATDIASSNRSSGYQRRQEEERGKKQAMYLLEV